MQRVGGVASDAPPGRHMWDTVNPRAGSRETIATKVHIHWACLKYEHELKNKTIRLELNLSVLRNGVVYRLT